MKQDIALIYCSVHRTPLIMVGMPIEEQPMELCYLFFKISLVLHGLNSTKISP